LEVIFCPKSFRYHDYDDDDDDDDDDDEEDWNVFFFLNSLSAKLYL